MKKILFFLAFSSGVLFANAQEAAKPQATPQQKAISADDVFSFKNDNHDFGKIVYGKAVEYDLFVKNNSKEPVKIDRVQVSCGCTTPKYDQNKTIAPGEEAKITLGFNGMSNGHFQKNATIFFSNGTTKLVKFSGETYKAPEEAAPANNAVKDLKKG